MIAAGIYLVYKLMTTKKKSAALKKHGHKRNQSQDVSSNVFGRMPGTNSRAQDKYAEFDHFEDVNEDLRSQAAAKGHRFIVEEENEDEFED